MEIAFITMETIHGLRAKPNPAELRSILEFSSVLRQFVQNIARLAAPLSKKLRKVQPTTSDSLDDEESRSMNSTKVALLSPPVLALQNSTSHMNLDTDASTVHVGSVILH